MVKFNTKNTKTAPRSLRATSPITTVSTHPDTRTHEGAPAYSREARSELFLATVGAFLLEDSFYEKGTDRLARVKSLTHSIALEEGGMDWLTAFTRWLRGEGNIRTAPIVVAAEAVHAWVQAGRKSTTPMPARARALINAAINRADEPGELLAYWMSNYGKPLPNSIKRGLADAIERVYSQYSTLKYDTGKGGLRFGDVVGLVRPVPKDAEQGDLFRHLIERGHGWADGQPRPIPESLAMLHARRELESVPVAARRALVNESNGGVPITERLKAAGATWEYLSGWLADGKGMDARAWEAVIPSMPYMARLRNLRNFDQAGISDEVAAQVAAQLSDPAQVAKSRQLPFRFLSAYEAAADNLRWAYPLEKALQASLSNIPAMPGRSLVLVDTSASMTHTTVSKHSKMTPVMAAAIFGVALAAKGEQVDLHGFADGVFRHPVSKGASVLPQVQKFVQRIGEVGHGTQIAESVRRSFNGHDRVFIISDMQTMGGYYGQGVGATVPTTVPIYGFNLGGYEAAAMPTGSGNRHEFGGLSDATFRLIPLLEAGANAAWPWEHDAR